MPPPNALTKLLTKHRISFFFCLLLLCLVNPTEASFRGSGLPVIVKIIFIIISFVIFVAFLYGIRRYMLMRREAAAGMYGGTPMVIATQRPGGQMVVTTISTGAHQHPPPPHMIPGTYYQPGFEGGAYFPPPHQGPPQPGFNVPGAPPPYTVQVPQNHQSYSK